MAGDLDAYAIGTGGRGGNCTIGSYWQFHIVVCYYSSAMQ
jgi:hypothetical protein